MSGKTVGAESGTIKKSKEISILVKIYLILYNFIQVIGWSYLLFQFFKFYTVEKDLDITLYDYVSITLIIFQNAAILEIIHAMVGFVSSNVLITTLQVFSRVMVVCGVLIATPTGKLSPGVPAALLAWSITEIIRYSYYGFNLLKYVPYPLVWLRYTTFIVLYPIGVTGELLCMFWAVKYARDSQLLSVEMPNKSNFTFSYYYFMILVMFMYLPTFPHLYSHMFQQRRKILGFTPAVKSRMSASSKVKSS